MIKVPIYLSHNPVTTVKIFQIKGGTSVKFVKTNVFRFRSWLGYVISPSVPLNERVTISVSHEGKVRLNVSEED